MRSAKTTILVLLCLAAVVALAMPMYSTPTQAANIIFNAGDPCHAASVLAAKENKTLVVMVGATWCQPCHEAERLYGKQLREMGVFVHVDYDAHFPFVRGVLHVATIPAVIIWRREHGHWCLPRRCNNLVEIKALCDGNKGK